MAAIARAIGKKVFAISVEIIYSGFCRDIRLLLQVGTGGNRLGIQVIH